MCECVCVCAAAVHRNPKYAFDIICAARVEVMWSDKRDTTHRTRTWRLFMRPNCYAIYLVRTPRTPADIWPRA